MYKPSNGILGHDMLEIVVARHLGGCQSFDYSPEPFIHVCLGSSILLARVN